MISMAKSHLNSMKFCQTVVSSGDMIDANLPLIIKMRKCSVSAVDSTCYLLTHSLFLTDAETECGTAVDSTRSLLLLRIS